MGRCIRGVYNRRRPIRMRSRWKGRLPILACENPSHPTLTRIAGLSMRNPSRSSFLTSPTTQIFGLAFIPVLVAAGWALIALDHHPDNENDQIAAVSLSAVAPALEQSMSREGEELERVGAMIARNPQFFAVLNLPRSERTQADFKSALENVLRDFQRDAGTPIFEVMDETGLFLARALQPAAGMTDISGAPFVRAAAAGRPGQGYMVEKGRVYRIASVPRGT